MEECLRRGYRNLQIRDITRRAGCALGTFYLHFKDKREVFRKLLRRYLTELRSQIDDRFKSATTPEEGIRLSFEAFFDFVESNRAAFALIFREGWMADPDFSGTFRNVFQAFVDDTRDRLRIAQALHVLRTDDAESLETAAWAMVGSLALVAQQWSDDPKMEKLRLVENLSALWRDALVKPGRAGTPLPAELSAA